MALRELVKTGADGIRRVMTRVCGGIRKVVVVGGGGPPPPCCAGCRYWKGTVCSHLLCAEFTFDPIFVCVGSRCPDTGQVLTNGQVVYVGPYCYRFNTVTEYCPLPGTPAHLDGIIHVDPLPGPTPQAPCEPLPPGAIIVQLAPPMACRENCEPPGCPEIDGCFPLSPCTGGCGGSPPCILYVTCSAYYESIALGKKVWSVPGCGCYYVHPAAVPSIGEHCFQAITTPATHTDCCSCCPSNSQCCYAEEDVVETTAVPGEPASQCNVTVTGHHRCCWERVRYAASGQVAVRVYYWNTDIGQFCLLRETVGTASGSTFSWTRTDYLYGGPEGCGGVSGVTSGNIDISCMPASEVLDLIGIPSGDTWNCAARRTSGTKRTSCDAASISGMTDNSDIGGTRITFNGSIAVIGTGEMCGSPGREGAAVGGTAGGGGGCKGCRSGEAAWKF